MPPRDASYAPAWQASRICLPRGEPMAKKARPPQPKQVRPDDIDPHHRWDRPLQAPGRTQVDCEERVDFRRPHNYLLGRVRAALAQCGLGALVWMDQHK